MTIFKLELEHDGFEWMLFTVAAESLEEAKELVVEHVEDKWVRIDGEPNYYADSFDLVDKDGQVSTKGLRERLKLKDNKPIAKGVIFCDYKSV